MGDDKLLEFDMDEEKLNNWISKFSTIGSIAAKGFAVAADAVKGVTAVVGEGIAIGLQYNASIENQSQTFNGLIATLEENAQQLLGEIVQPISESMVSTLLPAAIGVIEQLTVAFQTEGLEGMIQAGGQILANLLSGIAQALPGLLETVVQIIQFIIDSLNLNLPQIMGAGGQILLTLVSGIIMLLPSLAELALNMIFTLVSGLAANAPMITAQAGTMLITWINTILGMLPNILQSGASMIGTLLSGLVANAPQLITQAGQMLASYVSAVASHLPDILQKGIEIIGQLLAGIIREVPGLIAAIPGIIANIGSAFLDKDWAGIGWDIISGIGRGIASAAGNIVSAAVDAAKDAVNAVKGWLGINSPSRRMRDEVGKYMAAGMGMGFEQNIPTGDMAASVAAAVLELQGKAAAIAASSPATVDHAMKSVTNNYTGMGPDYVRLKKVMKESLDEANQKPIVLKTRQLRRGLKEEGFVQAWT